MKQKLCINQLCAAHARRLLHIQVISAQKYVPVSSLSGAEPKVRYEDATICRFIIPDPHFSIHFTSLHFTLQITWLVELDAM